MQKSDEFERSAMGRVLACLNLLLSIAAISGVIYGWQLRCESFGCMGLGVYWAAWLVTLFAPAFLLGLFLEFRLSRITVLARVSSIFWIMLCFLGVFIFAHWMISGI